MDDAQGIVLLALQRAGVSLPDDVHSVGDLRPKQLLPIYAHALALLRGSPIPELPTEFPNQRTARFRVCADLVAAFQQLGYRSELSFHQFLYPSEADTHRLLRFLLDQLSQAPSSAGKGRSTARRGRVGRIGGDDFGGSKISATVRHALTVCWDEANSSGDGKEGRIRAQRLYSGLGSEWVTDIVDGEENGVFRGIPFRTCPLRLSSAKSSARKQPPLITIQAKPRSFLIPSVVELNSRSAEKLASLADAELAQLARQADKLSRPLSAPEKKVISHGVLLLDKESHGEDARQSSSRLVQGVESVRSTNGDERNLVETPVNKHQPDSSTGEDQPTTIAAQAAKTQQEIAALELKNSKLQSESEGAVNELYLEDQRHVEETSNAASQDSLSQESVLQELEVTAEEREQRMTILQAEWDVVRSQLEEEIADSTRNSEGKSSEIQTKLRRMREMRQDVKDMTAKLWARETEEAQLSSELEKVAKGATRAVYVRRITELIRNSKKQDADIARIIHDTRELQRESNMTQDKLRRIHALVDETIFRDAKRDPICKQAYRLLTTIHGNFESIVEKVLEMDKVGREISELQAKLENLEKRHLDVASLEADLEAIIFENKALEKRLAELTPSKSTS